MTIPPPYICRNSTIPIVTYPGPFTAIRMNKGSATCGLSAGEFVCYSGASRYAPRVVSPTGSNFVSLSPSADMVQCGTTAQGTVACGGYNRYGAINVPSPYVGSL